MYETEKIIIDASATLAAWVMIVITIYQCTKNKVASIPYDKKQPQKNAETRDRFQPYRVIDLLKWCSSYFLIILIFGSVLLHELLSSSELTKLSVFLISSCVGIIILQLILIMYKYTLWKFAKETAPQVE